jgi:predicted site-specific integrase-resolvase
MKAKEVLKILDVSRVTLTSYVKKGFIKVSKKNNGLYDYDSNSVYNFIGKKNRKNVIYARVSTYKQKLDLINQINFVQSFCKHNKIKINSVYEEIDSGISLERTQFQNMLDEVINGKIKTVYISYKDRLSRLSFITLESIFKKFGTDIIIVSDVLHKYSKQNKKNSNAELFDDLLGLMHYFTTKNYSLRKNQKLYKYI